MVFYGTEEIKRYWGHITSKTEVVDWVLGTVAEHKDFLENGEHSHDGDSDEMH